MNEEIATASTQGRDAHGRLLPGHRFGGRPRGKANPVVRALKAAGRDLDDVRAALLQSTIAALESPEHAERTAARRLLASLLLPRSRPIDPGAFRGVETAEEAQAAVLGAMAAGVVSPEEAISASKVVAAFGEAGDWERLRELQEQAMRDREQGRIIPVSPSVGPTTED
jgi:hypothetical protein